MIKIKNIEDILQSSEVLYNEPLRNYSFTKTGGNAEILVKINNEKDLQNVIPLSEINTFEPLPSIVNSILFSLLYAITFCKSFSLFIFTKISALPPVFVKL